MNSLNIIKIPITFIFLSVVGCAPQKSVDYQSSNMKDSISVVVREYVFDTPQPFEQCHASTVLRTRDGKFLVAWFGGTHEKHDDVGIWLSKGGPGNCSSSMEIA